MAQWWHPGAWSHGGFTKADANPASISGLALWHESSRRNTLNGSSVATIINQTTVSTGDATQSTAANQAAQTENAINGYPAWTFDATNDTYSHSGLGLEVTRNVPGWTLITIVKPTIQSAGTRQIFNHAVASGATSRVGLAQNTSSAQLSARRLDADGAAVLTATGLTASAWHFVCARADFATTTGKLRVDNGTETTNTSFLTSGNTSNTASSLGALGSSGGGGLFWNGQIALLLFYQRSLSDAEVDKIRKMYSSKYNLGLT